MKLDSLEEIVKARKAKGLDNWKKLDHLKEKLQGKQSSHITFTTSYPGQEGSKKHLGSASGNLHFVLGYVNPGFHVAPYHWQLVDPNMSDEEASKMKHPANPRYWQEAGLEIEDEGDFDAGKPHKASRTTRNANARSSEHKTGSVTVQSGYGKYVAVPEEGVVYSLTNGHVYKWGLVRESFFAATNPDVTEQMEGLYGEGPGEVEKGIHSRRVKFNDTVYPLVRRHFPKPGSTFPVGNTTALVKSDRVEFFARDGSKTYVKVFDRIYDYFDLKKGGDLHPSILLQFAVSFLDFNKEDLFQFVHDGTGSTMEVAYSG
jgi:hypothetical protein